MHITAAVSVGDSLQQAFNSFFGFLPNLLGFLVILVIGYKASAYKADDHLVFGHPERGAVLDHSDLVRRFKRALQARGVREVRFHDLRHPMRTLQEWMGHRDFKTTLIYADYSPSGHEVGLVERAFSQELGPNWAPASAATERPTDSH